MPHLLAWVKHLSRPGLRLLVLLFGLRGAYVAARRARLPLSKNPRILLVHPGHLGSLVMMTALFHALKAHVPDAHVTVMVDPWSAEVLAGQPGVDRVTTCSFPSYRDGTLLGSKNYVLLISAAKEVRCGNYDLAINLRPDFWWGAALLYLARIPRRVGYALHGGGPFLTEALALPAREHRVVTYLRLLAAALSAMGYPSLEEPYTAERYPLYFSLQAQACQWVAERLSRDGFDPSTPLAVIHPGTGERVKLWRTAGWIACATTLAQTTHEGLTLHVVLTGSKSERPMLEEIAGGAPFPTTIMTDMSLAQFAALLGRAQLVLGVDSGPLHLAVALGAPTIQIFGPTDPVIFGPWGKEQQHAVVASTHRCPTCPGIPCMDLILLPRDPASHPCVRLVPEQEILAAISRRLPHIALEREQASVRGSRET